METPAPPPRLELGTRVEVDWLELGPMEKSSWRKGFVAGILNDGRYEAVSEEDLEIEHFNPEQLRRIDLDAEGFVSAAGLGFLTSVKEWVMSGNDVNVVVDGFTALYLACDEGQVEVVRYLVEEAGAQEDIENAYGVRAFDMAFLGGRPAAVDYAVRRRVAPARAAAAAVAAMGVPMGGGGGAYGESKGAHREWFLAAAAEHVPGLCSPGAAVFLPVGFFLKLEAQRLPSADDPGVRAALVPMPRRGRALYVSHGRRAHPSLTHVWLPAACLPAPRGAGAASPPPRRASTPGGWRPASPPAAADDDWGNRRLAATLAALHLCTHFLSLPEVGMLEISLAEDPATGQLSPDKETPPPEEEAARPAPAILAYGMTDVAEHLGRAWPLVELLAAQLAGARCHLHFLLDGVAEGALPLAPLVDHGDPEGGGGAGEGRGPRPLLPLHEAIEAALVENTTPDNEVVVAAILNDLLPTVRNPAAVLRDLAYTVLGLSTPAPAPLAAAGSTLAQLLAGALSFEELSWARVGLPEGPASLAQVALALGGAEGEGAGGEGAAEQAAALRAALLVVGFAMGRLPGAGAVAPPSPPPSPPRVSSVASATSARPGRNWPWPWAARKGGGQGAKAPPSRRRRCGPRCSPSALRGPATAPPAAAAAAAQSAGRRRLPRVRSGAPATSSPREEALEWVTTTNCRQRSPSEDSVLSSNSSEDSTAAEGHQSAAAQKNLLPQFALEKLFSPSPTAPKLHRDKRSAPKTFLKKGEERPPSPLRSPRHIIPGFKALFQRDASSIPSPTSTTKEQDKPTTDSTLTGGHAPLSLPSGNPASGTNSSAAVSKGAEAEQLQHCFFPSSPPSRSSSRSSSVDFSPMPGHLLPRASPSTSSYAEFSSTNPGLGPLSRAVSSSCASGLLTPVGVSQRMTLNLKSTSGGGGAGWVRRRSSTGASSFIITSGRNSFVATAAGNSQQQWSHRPSGLLSFAGGLRLLDEGQAGLPAQAPSSAIGGQKKKFLDETTTPKNNNIVDYYTPNVPAKLPAKLPSRRSSISPKK